MRAHPVHRSLWGLMLLFLAMQIWFALAARPLRAVIEEMPPPPTEQALKFMAFGDKEFLFRHLGRWLQNVGDGGGRVRPLREFDYDRVVGWLRTLNALNGGRSDYMGALATTYFGEVNIDPGRVRKIVDYLRILALSDPPRHWQLLVWCARAARSPIKDMKLLSAIAHDLQSPELHDPRVPAWVRVLPVRLYHLAGDEDAAKDALAHVTPEDDAEVAAMRKAFYEAVQRFKSRSNGTRPPPPGEP